MLGNTGATPATNQTITQEPKSYTTVSRRPNILRGHYPAEDIAQWKEKTVTCCGDTTTFAWNKCYGDSIGDKVAVGAVYASGFAFTAFNGLWAGIGGIKFLGAMAGPAACTLGVAATHVSCYIYHTYFSSTTRPFTEHAIVPVYDNIEMVGREAEVAGHVAEVETSHYDLIPEVSPEVVVEVIVEHSRQVVVEAVVETVEDSEEAPPIPPRLEEAGNVDDEIQSVSGSEPLESK